MSISLRIKESMKEICVIILLSLNLIGFGQKTLYQTETLRIDKISERAYVHTSFLETKEWGAVPCNGMVVVDHKEAIVVDAPITDSVSVELLDWIKAELKAIFSNVPLLITVFFGVIFYSILYPLPYKNQTPTDLPIIVVGAQ